MKIQRIAQSFNKAAHDYDIGCQLQEKTGEKLIAMLKKHSLKHNSILDAGCGTGLVTQKLALAFKYRNFYAIDIAEQFIPYAKEKLSSLNITVKHADFNEIKADILFDVIYSNLSLHWSPHLSHTLTVLRDNLSADGILAFSIPLLGTFKEIEGYCAINIFPNEASIKKIIKNCGFYIITSKQTNIIFEFDHIKNALMSIKKVGANYVTQRSQNISKFSILRQSLKSNQPIQLTYHIGWFILKKKEPFPECL